MDRINVWALRQWLRLDELKDREDGQAVTEYGIVLGVLMVLLVGTVVIFNDGITTLVQNVSDKLGSLVPGTP